MCIKQLPPVLTIQLKRFDYDWEEGRSLKFNDHFQVNRETFVYRFIEFLFTVPRRTRYVSVYGTGALIRCRRRRSIRTIGR